MGSSFTTSPSRSGYDVAIVGAGFYGCALAQYLAAQGSSVLVCESDDQIMERASAVNQARVHTGFHYPRSYVTALRSLDNMMRFTEDYAPAIRRDFKMLYAVARYGTKVNARRFAAMYEAMKAPISRATTAERAHFDHDQIEDVFACEEFAFNYRALRELVLARTAALPVEYALETRVEALARAKSGRLALSLADGAKVEADRVFNITYAQLNGVLRRSGLTPFAIRHELVEIALLDPPDFLKGLALTIMDGAYFSAMPWPAEDAYSLTHVRYTPHFSWTDGAKASEAAAAKVDWKPQTRWRHMIADAERYVPRMGSARWRRSLFDVKTVPLQREADDGRPILLNRHEDLPGLWSVLGSKIDNIYDLFEALERS